MSRLLRKTVILAKTHVSYGTDPVPTGAANAMLVSNVSIDPLNAETKDRDVIQAYLGTFEKLLGTRYKQVSFDVELVGGGALATAPKWGPLLRACGFAETVAAGFKVEYNPVSTAFDAVAIYYYDDGLLHKILGARGTCKLMMSQGDIPKMRYTFIGLDGLDSASANPAADTTGFRVPQVVVDQNTADVLWGATVTAGAAAPAITGGVAYPSQGLEIDLGISTPFTPLLGGETVEITQRDVTGFAAMDLSAAVAATFLDNARGAVKQAVTLQHGTVANDKVLVHVPAAQLIKLDKRDLNGIRLEGWNFNAVPTAGNDEIRIVTSFA